MQDMQDPTHDEMLAALAPTLDVFGKETRDEAEVAIYWFAYDWHGGGGSNLYSALSTSVYSPGPIATLESEGEVVTMLYDELESIFQRSNFT